jgi:23S rRNA (guanosine2251-2'-O)-methyltransferase
MVHSVILHDLRSTHNVGSILRTCDGFGVVTVYIGGTSPYPKVQGDIRLPHMIEKQTNAIAKTSLGAEKTLQIIHYDDIYKLLDELRRTTSIVALEQAENSIPLNKMRTSRNITLLLGREVEGIEPTILELCDEVVEIPMHGTKESFNVAVATGIALYGLTSDHR